MSLQLCVISHVLGYQFWKSSERIEGKTVKLHSCFYQFVENCYELFAREAYEGIFKKLLHLLKVSPEKKVALVQGTPGVGKTFFLFYMLYKFKEIGRRVVVSIGSTFLILDSHYPRMTTAMGIVNYCAKWSKCIYIHDPFFTKEGPAVRHTGLTIIITTSVNERNVSTVKHIPREVICMPIWTLSELEDCYACCYKDLLSKRSREKKVLSLGRVSKNCFHYVRQKCKRTIRRFTERGGNRRKFDCSFAITHA